jgi:hypothetical protein
VAFANPLHPLIDLDTKLNIACVGGTKPQTRSLASQLANMLDNLFEFAPQQDGSRMIKLECRYEYQPAPGVPNVSLPVFLLTPTNFAKDTDTKVLDSDSVTGDTGSLVCNIANSVFNWFDQNNPSSMEGTLFFDLGIFSTPNGKIPILRLRNLKLSVDHLSPQPSFRPIG